MTVVDTDGSQLICPTVLVTVLDAKLTALAVSALSGVEGQEINARVARFSDININAPASEFVASISWGDGSEPSAGIVGPFGPLGEFEVTGRHIYVEEGTYHIVVTIRDEGGSTLVMPVLVATISDAALTLLRVPPIAAIEGVPLVDFLIAQFTDANLHATAADFTATVTTWGESSPIPVRATVVQRGPGAFDVLVSLRGGAGLLLVGWLDGWFVGRSVCLIG